MEKLTKKPEFNKLETDVQINKPAQLQLQPQQTSYPTINHLCGIIIIFTLFLVIGILGVYISDTQAGQDVLPLLSIGTYSLIGILSKILVIVSVFGLILLILIGANPSFADDGDSLCRR